MPPCREEAREEADRDRRTSGVISRAADEGPRGLAVYFAIVIVLSGSVEAYIWMNPATVETLIIPLMWTPAVASVVARLVVREGFSDVSFRFGGLRTVKWYAVRAVVYTSAAPPIPR
jgi:hypothetical protein